MNNNLGTTELDLTPTQIKHFFNKFYTDDVSFPCEEIDALIGFFQKYWVSISSISKIAMERFFHLKGVLNGLFFIRNQIKFSSFIFNVLSIHCDKIIFCNNKYLSRNILKNSFDFPLESSWKNLFFRLHK